MVASAEKKNGFPSCRRIMLRALSYSRSRRGLHDYNPTPSALASVWAERRDNCIANVCGLCNVGKLEGWAASRDMVALYCKSARACVWRRVNEKGHEE